MNLLLFFNYFSIFSFFIILIIFSKKKKSSTVFNHFYKALNKFLAFYLGLDLIHLYHFNKLKLRIYKIFIYYKLLESTLFILVPPPPPHRFNRNFFFLNFIFNIKMKYFILYQIF
jgi:hypothetical protein